MKQANTRPNSLSHQVVGFVGSRPFFVAVLVVFALQAAWLAVSARYPMAFDEGFHMGIIRLYAQQWSPILTKQPAGPAPYGALATDPSYLFHYLLSFPYRVLHYVMANELDVIMLLRLLNVALMTAGLVLWRRVLLKTKASAAAVHATLLFFTLVPVVPLLAAHVNYDNLLMLLVPANLLLTLQFTDRLQRKKQISVLLFGLSLSMGLLASLVKFAYLPILTAITLYMVLALWRFGRARAAQRSWLPVWRATSRRARVATMVLCAVSIGLFLQRYAVNVVVYHNLVPQCGQVLDLERCQAYGPWARNYNLAQTKTAPGSNPAYFLVQWMGGMFLRSFFAINGPGKVAHYDNRPPLPLISVAAIVTFVAGVVLVVRRRREVLGGDAALQCMLLVGVVYVIALMGRNYHDYMQLGSMVAINGRYLVLIVLPVMVALAIGYERVVPERRRVLMLAVVLALFLQGGGILSYIHASNRNWYRDDKPAIAETNLKIRRTIRPLILAWPHDHIPFTK